MRVERPEFGKRLNAKRLEGEAPKPEALSAFSESGIGATADRITTLGAMALSEITTADIKAGFEAGRSVRELADTFGVPLITVVRLTEGLKGRATGPRVRSKASDRDINAAR